MQIYDDAYNEVLVCLQSFNLFTMQAQLSSLFCDDNIPPLPPPMTTLKDLKKGSQSAVHKATIHRQPQVEGDPPTTCKTSTSDQSSVVYSPPCYESTLILVRLSNTVYYYSLPYSLILIHSVFYILYTLSARDIFTNSISEMPHHRNKK